MLLVGHINLCRAGILRGHDSLLGNLNDGDLPVVSTFHLVGSPLKFCIVFHYVVIFVIASGNELDSLFAYPHFEYGRFHVDLLHFCLQYRSLDSDGTGRLLLRYRILHLYHCLTFSLYSNDSVSDCCYSIVRRTPFKK